MAAANADENLSMEQEEPTPQQPDPESPVDKAVEISTKLLSDFTTNLWSFGTRALKTATETVTSTVSNIASDFESTQQEFIKNNPSFATDEGDSVFQKGLASLLPLIPPKDPQDEQEGERTGSFSENTPWNNHPNRQEVKKQILALSTSKRNFLVPPPEVS